MPGPPPPPPPLAAPPPPAFVPPKNSGPDDRSALLKSIRTGAKLKKTVTVDKSAPIISGKIANNNSSSSVSSSGGGGGHASPAPNGLLLGGLFAGGMPKLRPTGKLGATNLTSPSNNNNENSNGLRRKPELPPQPAKSFNSVQNELKKQMASDNKNRGPPPPAPVRNMSEETNGRKPAAPTKAPTINGYRQAPPALHIQTSTLHRNAKSNVNLNSLDSTDSMNGFNHHPKPTINYGKPNLAPKPPTLNGKPMAPLKKPVSRAHSMRSPRSPSPQSPDNPSIKFGTVRNLSSVIGQSLANSSPKIRPALNGRPTAPPPSIPVQHAPPPPPHSPSPSSQPPLPPSKTGGVRPPNHAPPPPPGALPQPPNHGPPLPPHRTQPSRAPPAVPGLNAPPPPPRHSSMREVNTPTRKSVDFDEKFKHLFRHSNMFPKPPPYRHVLKLYSSRQAGSKQQAPQPPNLQSTPSKTWDMSSPC